MDQNNGLFRNHIEQHLKATGIYENLSQKNEEVYVTCEYNKMYKVFQTLTAEPRDPFAILSKPSARTQSAKP